MLSYQCRGVCLFAAANVSAEFEDISESARRSAGVLAPWRNLLLRRHRPQLVTAVMIPFFQEWTGLGALVIFGPEIFRLVSGFQGLGLGSKCAY